MAMNLPTGDFSRFNPLGVGSPLLPPSPKAPALPFFDPNQYGANYDQMLREQELQRAYLEAQTKRAEQSWTVKDVYFKHPSGDHYKGHGKVVVSPTFVLALVTEGMDIALKCATGVPRDAVIYRVDVEPPASYRGQGEVSNADVAVVSLYYFTNEREGNLATVHANYTVADDKDTVPVSTAVSLFDIEEDE